MPSLNMRTSHALGREEAIRRLKDKFSLAQAAYQEHVSDLHEEWNDGQCAFDFKAVGMQVAGTVTVDDSEVSVEAGLPLAAMIFKGAIESKIREELDKLLA